MRVLVINSGSSSVKFSLYVTDVDEGEPACLVDGEVSGIGADAQLVLRQDGQEQTSRVDAAVPEQAVHAIVEAVDRAHAGGRATGSADAVGYRVVHPGAKLDRHQLITEDVLRELDAAAVFAPLHNPPTLKIIREMMQRLPRAAHYACFDTIFHQTMPEEAYTYPVPAKFRDGGVRRYGFHGLSCESIVRRLTLVNGTFPRRAVIAHLGSGCSVTALADGRSVDTTMGLTPTGGVMMGTRPGDLDPGLMLYLAREVEDDLDLLEEMFNRDSGLVSVSGMKNDVKALRVASDNGNEAARLSLRMFTRSVSKAIGAFVWLLGGLDAVIFSGGIGEHDGDTRSEVLASEGGSGIRLQDESGGMGARKISSQASSMAVWVVPAEEDLAIVFHVEHMAGSVPRGTLPTGTV